MTKSEIRSFVKGLVRGISVVERARFSEALKEEVVGLECWRSAKEVMLFFSLPDEVDMLPLIRAALAEQKRIYLPRVIATQVSRGVDVCEVAEGNTLPKESTLPAGNTVSGEEMILEVRELAPGQLAPGRWGIWEPTDEAPLLSDYSRLDLVVVPGVAFSSDGKRLGRGKSFYDRFLPLVPRAAFVGVCYPCQVVEQIPADPWDIGMDIVCCGEKR
ncbi:MAG: 5-formyltetrahydrofolate cyclo-ligase [Candidatus Egerieousia sp.]|nr:5-formyltetrahydrofolate cyclo-ligase [Candidatus Egerieousia sp.]